MKKLQNENKKTRKTDLKKLCFEGKMRVLVGRFKYLKNVTEKDAFFFKINLINF